MILVGIGSHGYSLMMIDPQLDNLVQATVTGGIPQGFPGREDCFVEPLGEDYLDVPLEVRIKG